MANSLRRSCRSQKNTGDLSIQPSVSDITCSNQGRGQVLSKVNKPGVPCEGIAAHTAMASADVTLKELAASMSNIQLTLDNVITKLEANNRSIKEIKAEAETNNATLSRKLDVFVKEVKAVRTEVDQFTGKVEKLEGAMMTIASERERQRRKSDVSLT